MTSSDDQAVDTLDLERIAEELGNIDLEIWAAAYGTALVAALKAAQQREAILRDTARDGRFRDAIDEVLQLRADLTRVEAERDSLRRLPLEIGRLQARIAELEGSLRDVKQGLEHVREFRIADEEPDKVGASSEMRVLARAYLERLESRQHVAMMPPIDDLGWVLRAYMGGHGINSNGDCHCVLCERARAVLEATNSTQPASPTRSRQGMSSPDSPDAP